ncbi:MAG: sulfotransferase [Sulfuricurvum sp.]|jgi:hypothetical protein|uniref:sulfotransferase family protein n=1 Tax=Sulfuricurvum sp. TaxID=2025608 RepID=UPI0025E86991|nr:sulfotransferase [Sulfuricurvum sp.]MCK9372280.1 sulfotransferase [Sulfuricurvum sp.]
MLPNFIIVGAPKAGTTSLYYYLSEHPQVFMSDPKEVNFFSREEIERQGLYYDSFRVKSIEEYEKLFETVSTEKAIGEGSVSYLFYPETAEKIKEMLPDVKIIILLRDPIERGFSHYLMDYRLGLVSLPFEAIVNKSENHKNMDLYYQQYIELGLYYEQVKRYLDLFGEGQVKIYLQEELRKNSDAVIKDLYDFLEIDPLSFPDTEREHNVFSMPRNKFIHALYASYPIRTLMSVLIPNSLKDRLINLFFDRKNKPKLDQRIKEDLLKLFTPDIKNLEQLIGRDLSHWYKG